MSTERDVTRIVRSWLEEGATALPDRVLDNVLDRLPATPQRRPRWSVRRLRQMSTPFRIAIAAAAVVVVAVIGVNLVPKAGGTNVGGPPSTPAPTLKLVPTASPSPTPIPTMPTGSLAPGTYHSDFITFVLPAGWVAEDGFTVVKPSANPPNGMVFNTWRDVTVVYGDPCHWQSTAVSVGSVSGATVDELTTALVAQKRGTIATPVDVTVDGFRGKEIDLMVPLNVKIADCDGGLYKAWTLSDGGDRYNQGPGQHDLVDILDVNGKTLLIKRSFYPANTAADLAELQAIFNSVTVTP